MRQTKHPLHQEPDILKVDFLRGQNFSFEILSKKKEGKYHTKNRLICVKHEEKNL